MDYFEWFPKRLAELRMQKGVSARDMSLSLGQSESYINKIENRRVLPSMCGFIYICEFLGITPGDFFNVDCIAPAMDRKVVQSIEKLTFEQAEHIFRIVADIVDK